MSDQIDPQTDLDPSKVYYFKTNEGSAILSDASVVTYLGMPCIKGRGVGMTSNHWADGAISYVAIRSIIGIVVYDSIRAYRDTMERHEQAKKEREKNQR